MAESRLRYDPERAEVQWVADRVDAPYAGVHRMAALEFLARWVDHVPERRVVRRILAHLWRRGEARAGPWAGVAAAG